MANRHPHIRPALSGIRTRLGRAGLAAGRVDINFVDDRSIAKMAGRFRGSPHATDVLAFDFARGNHPEVAVAGAPRGEIFISLDTAHRQARKRRVPFSHELTLLCVHGLLHLVGMRDERLCGWCGMRRREFEEMMRIL